MSGFSGIYLFNQQLSDRLNSFSFPDKLQGYFTISHRLITSDFVLRQYNNGKFKQDTFVREHENTLLGFDGVNLNNTNFEPITDLASFVKIVGTVKGSFVSVFKDQKKHQLTLIADQTGSKQIFYYWNSSFFAFSSSIFLLKDILRHFDIRTNLSIPASYMLLSLGYMLDDYTLVSEIKKLTAGNYINVNKDGVHIKKYHDYHKNVEYNKISNELLDELNKRFKKSLELEYEKDRQYDFDHISTLSGGLDSRLNVILAYKSGYKNISCITYSEGFKSDELTSRKITNDFSLKHILVLLNQGFHLYDIETPLILNNCTVHYFGAAHTFTGVKAINFSNYGLFHNGILAESSKGTYLSGKEHCPPKLDSHFRISEKLFCRLDKGILDNIFRKYSTTEMFVTYSRGFNAAHNGSWMTMPFTDSVSTYMDLDFADLAYSVHPKLRYGGYLTVEWIKSLVPEAGNYEWQRGIKPTNNPSRLLVAKVSNKLKRLITQKQDIAFPINEWYDTNPDLRQYIGKQFKNTPSWDITPSEIQKDLRELYLNGDVGEKFLCISYLKSIELLFIL